MIWLWRKDVWDISQIHASPLRIPGSVYLWLHLSLIIHSSFRHSHLLGLLPPPKQTNKQNQSCLLLKLKYKTRQRNNNWKKRLLKFCAIKKKWLSKRASWRFFLFFESFILISIGGRFYLVWHLAKCHCIDIEVASVWSYFARNAFWLGWQMAGPFHSALLSPPCVSVFEDFLRVPLEADCSVWSPALRMWELQIFGHLSLAADFSGNEEADFLLTSHLGDPWNGRTLSYD